jgi:hypothetical protein
MTIYQDSKRIVGTNTDKVGAPAISGGWKELGRTTLGSANASMNTTSLSDKRYYMILTNSLGYSGVANSNIRFNSDSGSNYAERVSVSGGTDTTGTGYNFASFAHGNTATENFGVGYLSNLSSKEKLWTSHNIRQNTAGAGNAPIRSESVGKWANTTNEVSGIDILTGASTTHDSGSETVILGYDPDDTHTDNFWEELADVTLSGASSSLDSGTITAKKYLWYQVFIKKNSASNNYAEHSINGITTGNTWARRISSNGGTDGTNTSQNTMNTTDTGAGGYFLNGFVINSSGNEKLFIEHVIQNTSSGVNAPDRKEIVMKSTTSAQITQLTVTGATNGYDSGSFIKVWGSN